MRLLFLLLLVAVVSAGSVRDRRERLRNEDQLTIPDEQHLEDLLPCTLAEDCPSRNCKEKRCDTEAGICVYDDYRCPGASTDDQCTIVLGCDVDTNICRYDLLMCDDFNDCTEDTCFREADADMPYCVHTEKSDCTEYNTHAVQFRVENARHLDVDLMENGSGLRLCHTSTITNPDEAAVLIGFSPYDDCSLASRGTCDNRMSGFNRPEIARIQEDNLDVLSSINFVSSTLYWSEQSSISTVNGYTLNTHVFGFMKDTVNEGVQLRVDLLFAQSGKLINGDIRAAAGSQYDGLIFSLGTASLSMGYGANNVNGEPGFQLDFTAQLASQAHDSGLVILGSDGVYTGYLRGTTIIVPAKTVNYCDLLDSENVQRPLWSEERNEALSTTSYCTEMSLESLLKCRTSDDRYGALFKTSVRDDEDITVVEGALYHSILQKPTAIVNANSAGGMISRCNDACAVKQTTSTVYNITMLSNGTHIMHAYIDHVDFDLQLKWLGNEWLCCAEEDAGDLRVNFETSIVNENGRRRLTNARVEAASETGVPMFFSEAENAEGRWSLRTHGQGRRIDFTSEHRLLWDVVEGDSVIGHVASLINVNARHVGRQDHLVDGRVDADVELFTDRFFTEKFVGKSLDGEQLYASVCLDTNRHLDLLIDQVFICYSDYTIKSCSDANVKSVLLYSRSTQDTVSSIHGFEFVRNPPSTSHCEGFTFLTRGYTKANQYLQVFWSTQEYGGNGGVISMYSDDDEGDHDHWSHSDGHEFHSHCPHSWSFDWDAGHCNEWRGGDEAMFWIFLIFFVILVLIFSCGCLNRWSFNNEQAIASRPPPPTPQPQPQLQRSPEYEQQVNSKVGRRHFFKV